MRLRKTNIEKNEKREKLTCDREEEKKRKKKKERYIYKDKGN